MSTKYNFNHGIYNPAVNQKGKILDQSRTFIRNDQRKVLKTPELNQGGFQPLFPFNREWFDDQKPSTRRVITEEVEKTNKALTRRYPFTYIADPNAEKKFAVRSRFVDEKGRAINIQDQPGNKMGLAYLPPEYFQWRMDQMKKDEAEQFKVWVFNQMDISTPVKKEYWKKRCPELFDELMEATAHEYERAYMTSMIELYSPQTEDEFLWLYNNVYMRGLYNNIVQPDGPNPPNPSSLPFPQLANDLGNKTPFSNLKPDGSTESSWGLSLGEWEFGPEGDRARKIQTPNRDMNPGDS
jgi:hypothetical protein